MSVMDVEVRILSPAFDTDEFCVALVCSPPGGLHRAKQNGGSNPLTRIYISTSPKGLSAIRRESFFCGWSTGDTFSGDTGDTVIHPVPSCDTSDSDQKNPLSSMHI